MLSTHQLQIVYYEVASLFCKEFTQNLSPVAKAWTSGILLSRRNSPRKDYTLEGLPPPPQGLPPQKDYPRRRTTAYPRRTTPPLQGLSFGRTTPSEGLSPEGLSPLPLEELPAQEIIGMWYTSYWNAFLLFAVMNSNFEFFLLRLIVEIM